MFFAVVFYIFVVTKFKSCVICVSVIQGASQKMLDNFWWSWLFVIHSLAVGIVFGTCDTRVTTYLSSIHISRSCLEPLH